jgi:hypothetical protein
MNRRKFVGFLFGAATAAVVKPQVTTAARVTPPAWQDFPKLPRYVMDAALREVRARHRKEFFGIIDGK